MSENTSPSALSPDYGSRARLRVELGWGSGSKPDPVLTVSQWADEHRVLSQKAASEPGRWRTNRTPYLREIMDALSTSSSKQRVVFMKGAQVGGTEAGNNWIGYVMRRTSIPAAIRQCVALGFLEVTQAGRPAISDFRRPSLYRLTYLAGRDRSPEPTHEWRAIGTNEAASAAVAKAAQAPRSRTTKGHPLGDIDSRPKYGLTL